MRFENLLLGKPICFKNYPKNNYGWKFMENKNNNAHAKTLIFSVYWGGWKFNNEPKFLDIVVALKRLKMEKEKQGFPITALREIK